MQVIFVDFDVIRYPTLTHYPETQYRLGFIFQKCLSFCGSYNFFLFEIQPSNFVWLLNGGGDTQFSVPGPKAWPKMSISGPAGPEKLLFGTTILIPDFIVLVLQFLFIKRHRGTLLLFTKPVPARTGPKIFLGGPK